MAGILGIPGVGARDLVTVYPVVQVPGADPDIDRPTLGTGTAFDVISREISSSQAHREGRQPQNVNFTLYATWKRNTAYPISRNERLWHPGGCSRHGDGSPDLETALDVFSVVGSPVDSIVTIECGRGEEQ
jgi:hypothetical protein